MRPTEDQVLMQITRLWSRRSTCLRKHVGCVIARQGRIITTGYNGAPAGMPHCVDCDQGEGPCRVAVHAEANALAFAARFGYATEGATLFTSFSPCLACAQIIVNAGIVRVIYGAVYDRDGNVPLALLAEAGLAVGLSDE